MPRSRTDDAAWLNVISSDLERLADALKFGRLKRDPNQVISVLSGFSCSLFEAHRLATSEVQTVGRSRTDAASTTVLLS